MRILIFIIVILSLFLLVTPQDITQELADIQDYNLEQEEEFNSPALEEDQQQIDENEEFTEAKPSEKKQQESSWNNGNASNNFGVATENEKKQDLKTEANPSEKKDQASWNNGNASGNYGVTEEEEKINEAVATAKKKVLEQKTILEQPATVKAAIDPKTLLKETEAPSPIKPIGTQTSWGSQSMKILVGVLTVFVVLVFGVFAFVIFVAASKPTLIDSAYQKDTHYIQMPNELTDEELDSLIRRNASQKYTQSYKVPTTQVQ